MTVYSVVFHLAQETHSRTNYPNINSCFLFLSSLTPLFAPPPPYIPTHTCAPCFASSPTEPTSNFPRKQSRSPMFLQKRTLISSRCCPRALELPHPMPLQVTATVFLGLECRADVLLQVLQ